MVEESNIPEAIATMMLPCPAPGCGRPVLFYPLNREQDTFKALGHCSCGKNGCLNGGTVYLGIDDRLYYVEGVSTEGIYDRFENSWTI